MILSYIRITLIHLIRVQLLAGSHPISSWQTLKVYDVLGKEIITLVDEERPAGLNSVELNAVGLSSGIYFYSLITDQSKITKSMIILK